MSVAKLIEELATKIGEDEDFLKALESGTNREVTDFAYRTIVDTIKNLFLAADQIRALEKQNVIDTTGHTVERPIDVEGLEMVASLATAYDESGDEDLIKIASVLDELLFTVAVPKDKAKAIKLADEAEVNKLREKYRGEALEKAYGNATLESEKEKNTDDTVKAINNRVKAYRPMEHALSTRYSPDMPGVSLIRIGDGVFQCPVTKKIYNYEGGFSLMSGEKVPGGSVSNQTQQLSDQSEQHSNFSTREEILNNS